MLGICYAHHISYFMWVFMTAFHMSNVSISPKAQAWGYLTTTDAIKHLTNFYISVRTWEESVFLYRYMKVKIYESQR